MKNEEKVGKIKLNLALIYFLFLFILLFARKSAFVFGMPYKEQIRAHFEKVLFYSITHYWNNLIDPGAAVGVRWTAFINLAGNFFLFVPLGYFLATFFKTFRTLITCALGTAVIIFLAECIQAMTLVGTFDVDDIFLNTCGSIIGYIFWKICHVIENYNKNKENPYTMT